MADYIFSIPSSGCTNKEIGSYPSKYSESITDFNIEGDTWGISISTTESDDVVKIQLSVGEWTDTHIGRTEDIVIKFKVNGEDCDGINVTLCQPNKHGDTPEPPVPVESKLILFTTSGKKYSDCDEGGKVSINASTITALTEDKT